MKIANKYTAGIFVYSHRCVKNFLNLLFMPFFDRLFAAAQISSPARDRTCMFLIPQMCCSPKSLTCVHHRR